MAAHHDSLFHGIFADPPAAAALLRAALPRRVAAAVAWASLAECSAHFVDDDLGTHAADLVFEAPRRDCAASLLFLVEHKSESDPQTVLQLQRYEVHLLQKWRAAHPEAGCLPRVVPIVVHHGPRPWSAPTTLHELRPEPDPIAEHLPPRAFGFLLDDLAQSNEDELAARDLPAAARLALLYLQCARGRPPADVEAALRRWHHHLAAVAAAPGGPANLQVFHSYLLKVTDLPAPRLAAVVAHLLGQAAGTDVMSTADKLIAEGMQRGLDQGRAEGKAEGKAEQLLRLLRKRFGGSADAVAVRVAAASNDDLDRWAERLLDAATIAEVFAAE